MIKVYVSEVYFGDCLQVFVVDNMDHGKFLLQYSSEGRVLQWAEVSRDGQPLPDAELKPTIELPRDSGRALLDALVRYYQGAEDTRQLRRDYDAERKRVDEQAKVIADIAQSLARGGDR